MSEDNTTAHASAIHLLMRLESDMLSCYRQIEVLKIVFKNLEGSWLAIHLAYKIVKDELKEER